jgi:hypothetical protein
MDGLSCLSCQKPVDPNEAKLFAKMFVCPTCYTVATRLKTRLTDQLKFMIVTLDETIRLSIVDHKLLSLLPTQNERDATKKEVLEAILQLQDARETSAPRVTTTTIKEKHNE